MTSSLPTIAPGALTIASALPDPPFELDGAAGPAGFDVDWTTALCATLGLEPRFRRFEGADFNAIFDGLGTRAWDCVASGTTVTPERARVALFCAPYLTSGQALACAPAREPGARSVDDLGGLVLGVQQGNTSQPVAEALRAQGKVAGVRAYPYHAIGTMLDDLEAGHVGAVMKLGPVLRWLIRDRPALSVVQEGITTEAIALAVAPGNDALRAALDTAQRALVARGTYAELEAKWLGK